MLTANVIQGTSQVDRFNVSLPPDSIPTSESCSFNVIGK